MPMGTGGGDVRIDRRLERLQRGKTLLITQFVVESHRKTPAIKVAGKIQKVHLKVGAAVTGDGRTHANVGDARPGLAIDLRADQIDSAQWHATTLELHVGGGRTQLARQLLAVQNPSGDLERATEQTLGKGEVRTRQGFTHLSTADPDAIDFNSLRCFYAKSVGVAGLLQEVEVPNPVAAETEVIAHFKMQDTEAVDQHGLDEVRCTELAQPLIERQTQHPVNTLLREQFQLVAQTRQTCRRGFRREELTRLRLENHHAAGYAQLDRTLAKTRQNSLVAAMYTVEIANRGDATPMMGAQIVEASDQLHNALLAHKVADYNHTRPWTTGNTPGPDNSCRYAMRQTDSQPLKICLQDGLASEIPKTKAHQQKHGEIGNHTRDDKNTQAHETFEHNPLIPCRHPVHKPQQDG